MTERCPECAFAEEDWSADDVQTTVPVLDALWQLVVRDDTARRAHPEGGPAPTDLDGLHRWRHDLHLVGRRQAATGEGTRPATGTVVALHRSDGGVPKAAVAEVAVTWRGVVGDRQADRRHHGRPFQALCLWSAEVIEALQAEGHPIVPGAAGENLTVEGLDWAGLRPGALVQVGEVLAEISSYAVPCAKNAQWFADRGYRRIHHEDHPGWSRLYAWVLRPGTVGVGDAVRVEP